MHSNRIREDFAWAMIHAGLAKTSYRLLARLGRHLACELAAENGNRVRMQLDVPLSRWRPLFRRSADCQMRRLPHPCGIGVTSTEIAGRTAQLPEPLNQDHPAQRLLTAATTPIRTQRNILQSPQGTVQAEGTLPWRNS